MQTSTRFAVAIHILTLLAQDTSGPATSELLAGSVNTNPVVIRRVLGYLRNQGLVESAPGAGGGWRLLREPDEISLREVYRAVEQGQLLNIHERPNPRCPVGRNIQQVLEAKFTAAQAAMEQALAGTTIADILSDVRLDAGVAA
jgi:Rrf2 family protein